MIRESIAILALCGALLAAMSRYGYKLYVPALLPVALIPAAHLLVKLGLYVLRAASLGVRPAVVLAFADVAAIAASCALVVLFSRYIKQRRLRRVYVVLMTLYSLLLGWAFLYDSLYVLLV